MSEQTIRVMTVDDHEILRGGIRYLLLAFDDIELVGEAHSGEEAIQLCAQVNPDVVLMDMMMTGMDGATTTEMLRQNHPQTQVVILTSFPDKENVQRALQAGALGFLLKGSSIDQVANAIRAAHQGQPMLAPEATKALIQSATSSKRDYGLTERQQEVLVLLVAGKSNKEIAEALTLSPYTVRHHVSELLAKLEVSNRAEAAVLAVQQGLVKKPAD